MRLSAAEITAFLNEPHTLVLATLRRDGWPQMSTVWYRWDGEAFWIATDRDRAKYRNIQRDPRVAALVDAPSREASVVAYGRAEVVARAAAAYEGALRIVARYVDDPRAYLDAREEAGRVLIRIKPEQVVSWKREG